MPRSNLQRAVLKNPTLELYKIKYTRLIKKLAVNCCRVDHPPSDGILHYIQLRILAEAKFRECFLS